MKVKKITEKKTQDNKNWYEDSKKKRVRLEVKMVIRRTLKMTRNTKRKIPGEEKKKKKEGGDEKDDIKNMMKIIQRR